MFSPYRSLPARVQPAPMMWLSGLFASITLVMAQPTPSPRNDLASALAAYDAGDFATAMRSFVALARSGDSEAAYMAGLMHHRGRGTPPDFASAARYYAQAAERNVPQALTNLGILHRDGDGQRFPIDLGKAREYLRRAAYLGDTAGQLALAALLVNDPANAAERHEGLAFMQLAAAAGDRTARDNLARLTIDAATTEAVAALRRRIETDMARLRRLPTAAPQAEAAKTGTDAHGAGILHLRRFAIRDPMTADLEALEMVVPQQWQARGQIEWLLDQSVLANAHFEVRDPQSGVTLRSLPYRQFTFTPDGVLPPGSNHLGMTVSPPVRDPEAFVAQFWMRDSLAHLRNARIVRKTPLPALARLALRDWGADAQCDGWQLRYAYQRDGETWHEDVTFALLFSTMNIWHVTRCHSASGPQSALDRHAGVLHAMVASVQLTPQWQARWRICYELFVRRARQVMVDARKLQAAFAENREQLARLQAEVERERDASQSAQHRALQEALGGIETWRDAQQGRSIEIPQGYRRVFVSDTGEYLLSERTDFDPNAGSTVRWRQLEPSDPLGARTRR